ncbi:hypothetical protein LTR56_021343 [Elasticomyces elasticus]|nr:hypothetical protein LTR56_021343 [Elasticomyces elasticus]KAK3631684.1 hypothetical protein LTR22_020974 [Elasticomyces elasticus]KAK4909557.1 hypothetical protein LTR49_021674 [Elasticomyces elasticus]KAK5754330.1 hypothetical protein LTS12_015621 [Elasticomyces elasticus]
MALYENVQNRLCRWQRLTQFPPERYIRHDAAFAPVQSTYERLVAETAAGEEAMGKGWEVVREACWGGK